MGKADRDVVGPKHGSRHRHHMGVVLHGGANADAQEFVRDVARDLCGAADAVEIALARAGDESRRPGSQASMSVIARVSSSAWSEERNTLLTISLRRVVERKLLVHLRDTALTCT